MSDPFKPITDAGTQLADSYTKMFQDQVEKTTKAIAKLTALGIDDFSDAFEDAADLMDDLGTAIDMASTVASAMEENPLVQALMSRLNKEFGFDFASPLGLVKALLSGKGEPLMKVAGAMLKFPLKASMYLDTTNDVIVLGEQMIAELEAQGIDLNEAIQPETLNVIPPEVTAKMRDAYRKIGSSLQLEFVETNYAAGQNDLKDALDILSSIKTWATAAGSEVLNVALLTVFNAIGPLIKNNAMLQKDLKKELQDLIIIITTTPIILGTNKGLYAKAKKALHELHELTIQMSEETDYIQVSQYMLTLATLINVFKLGKPSQTTLPLTTPLGNTSIGWNPSNLNSVYMQVGRIYSATQNLYKLKYLKDSVESARLAHTGLQADIDGFNAELDNLWLSIPDIKDLIESVSSMLDAMGMDQAASMLMSGDISGILSLSDTTASVIGKTLLAMQAFMDVLNLLGLHEEKAKIEKIVTDLKKKMSFTVLKQESKKKTKVAKLKKKIDEVSEGINELAEVVEMISGLAQVITAIVEVNT